MSKNIFFELDEDTGRGLIRTIGPGQEFAMDLPNDELVIVQFIGTRGKRIILKIQKLDKEGNITFPTLKNNDKN